MFSPTSFFIPRAKRSNSIQEVRDRETQSPTRGTRALPQKEIHPRNFRPSIRPKPRITANQKQDETSETRQINVEDLLMNLFIRVHSWLNATRIMKMTRDV